jgi:phage/plasmid-associated DNA primase
MILEKYWYDGLLKDINEYVVAQMGIKISFKNKPFDEAIEIPEFNNIKSVDEWMDLLSAKKLADRFLEEWNEIVIKYNCNIYIYYDNRWYDETKAANQHKFTICISENLYDKLFSDIESDVSLKVSENALLMKLLRNATSNTNAINNIIKHIISKAKETEKDFNSNPFLLGFNNGVYDLMEDEFRDYKYDDYITLSTKYDYSMPDYDDPVTIALKEDLVGIIEGIQPNEENRLLFLQILASGLDGRAYQKLFLLNGQGGNGKGLTGSLMDSILGDYYHQPANGIIKDVEKANTPSPDMINLKNKRYINFKEVQGAVKVAMLRNLTGGGKFSGRYLNQNPESFSMTATFVMEFNVAPELDGKPQGADYRRLVDLDFPINFTDDPNKIGKVIGGILYKKANSRYETQEFLQSVKLIFLDLLLGIYRSHKSEDNTGIVFKIPENIRKRTELFIENQNLFQRVFNELWCKVEVDINNKLDVKDKTVTLKEIWESIMASEDHRKLNYKEKRLYNRDEFYKWIETLFKIAGNTKTGKLIIGLQRKEDVDEIIDGDVDDTATENIL